MTAEIGGRARVIYEVRDGRITIKGEQYPIKLADGLYIIRKLTVLECKRLQTVPDSYIFPVSDTQAYVEQNHRHHGKVVGHKFSIGLSNGEEIVGVAIVGRPVGRYTDDGWTLEVNRLCTDGSRNACSMLYAAAWRATRAMGYKRLITYILDTEPGTSLKAAGWKCVGQAGGLRWTGKRRPQVDLYPAQMKIRWEIGTEEAGAQP